MLSLQAGSSELQRKRKLRLFLLIACLCIVSSGYIVQSSVGLFRNSIEDPIAKQKRLESEARDLPTESQMQDYLDGKTILPTDADGVPIPTASPIVIQKGSIEGLAITRDDVLGTMAKFKLESDRGKISVDLMINQGFSDGIAFVNKHTVLRATSQ